MKCRVCREPAVIDLRQHNANFCVEHFTKFCRDQTEKAISEFAMFDREDRLLVAVSGGKDSLAVWDILASLGYSVDGLYIGLGIGDYSEESARFARSFAHDRGLKLIEVSLTTDYGYDVPTASVATRRVPCSACGISKRHIFDSVAIEGGYHALVTGHNLDDEAAVLYGNVMHWQVEYLGRQKPVLPAEHGFPRKVKPLVRLGEREMAAYCLVTGIDYIIDECPMAIGNKHIAYKESLNLLELESPGAKQQFYFGFLRSAAERFDQPASKSELGVCSTCGSPSAGELCSFCRLAAKAASAEPVPVSMMKKARK